MENKSKYGDRKTLGAEYIDMLKNRPTDKIEVGDMRNELMSSLIEDLNEELYGLPKDKNYSQYEDRPYYVRFLEKRDYIMPDVFRRTLYRSIYRPYPEPDSLVFWRSADRSTIKFCWQLPEHYQMQNMLAAADLFPDRKEEIRLIKHWENMDLHHFGFIKNEMGNWMANPHWKGDTELKSSFTPTLIIA